jgi:hypothetical protein
MTALVLMIFFRTMIPVYLDHIPAGTSTRPLIHYAQLHKINDFVKFDFKDPGISPSTHPRPFIWQYFLMRLWQSAD